MGFVKTVVSGGLMAVMIANIQAQDGYDDEDLLSLYADDEVVSIATGTDKPIHLAPSVASVITQEDIRNMGATDLDQVLESVPGLHVSKSFNRLNSIYSVRGIHTSQNPQMLLMINGAKILNAFTGGRPTVFRMPVENIKRIEVMRGPGSAVYGADAFSGVINVITKDGQSIDGTDVGVRAGSFKTRELWLQHGRQIGDWDFAFSTEYSGSDGDTDRIVKNDLQSQLENNLFPFLYPGLPTDASLAPGPIESRYELLNSQIKLSNERWDIGLYAWNLFEAGQGPGGAQALDPVGEVETNFYLLNMHYRWALSGNWDADLNYISSYGDEDGEFVLQPAGAGSLIGPDGNLASDPLAATPVTFSEGVLGRPSAKETSNKLELTTYYNGMDGHLWRTSFGGELQEGDAKEQKNYGPGVLENVQPYQNIDGTLTDVTGTENIFVEYPSRKIWFISLQDEWQFSEDWVLTAGLRYDNYSDFGDTINPRIALVWATTYNLASKFLYGRAFRAPSIAEQFAMNNPAIIGNPDLDPETIDTIELAFDHRLSADLGFTYNFFAYEINDLIDYVQTDLGSIAENARQQRGYGFEVEANWQITEQLHVLSNYSWQRSEDKDSGADIADAPFNQFYLAGVWAFEENWLVSTQLNWVAGRERAVGDLRDTVDDDLRIDLSLRRLNLFRYWEVALSITNLLDETISEPSNSAANGLVAIPGDYPMPGRSILGEIRYHF